MTNRAQQLLQAATCLLCAAVAWKSSVRWAGLGATEFGGGRVTGPMLDMHDMGTVLFPLAPLLTFMYPRIAAIALAASVLSLPLYLYFAAPGPFRWVVRGNWKVPLQANFYWDNWTIAGIITLVLATYICIRTLRTIKGKRVSRSSPAATGPG